MPQSRFHRASAVLPSPLEGWGAHYADDHGRCIVCEKPANRAVRRYAARLLGRDSRRKFPTVPYCRDCALTARAAMSMGQPILVPEWMVDA